MRHTTQSTIAITQLGRCTKLSTLFGSLYLTPPHPNKTLHCAAGTRALCVPTFNTVSCMHSRDAHADTHTIMLVFVIGLTTISRGGFGGQHSIHTVRACLYGVMPVLGFVDHKRTHDRTHTMRLRAHIVCLCGCVRCVPVRQTRSNCLRDPPEHMHRT